MFEAEQLPACISNPSMQVAKSLKNGLLLRIPIRFEGLVKGFLSFLNAFLRDS